MTLTSILCQTADQAAPAADAAQGSSFMNYLLIIVFIVLIVWMMFIQPRKQQKKRQEQINQMEKGSKVITNSGIYGRIKEIKDKAFVSEIAEGVKITVDKTCVYPLSDADAATAQN